MKTYRKIIAILLAVGLVLPGAGLVTFAEEVENVHRLAGADRYKTAVAVSEETYKGTADAVVLAGGMAEVDALTGTLLAKAKDAPLLYTDKAALTAATKDEIARLKPTTVYVLGGKAAVEEAVVEELETLGYIVERVEGLNRQATAAAVAEEANFAKGHAFIVRDGVSSSLVDALAVAPASYKMKSPVFLTKHGALHPETKEALKGYTSVTVIGGETAVSKAVETELTEMGLTVNTRVAGLDRDKTAVAIANKYFAGATQAVLANGHGKTLVDALVGGYLGGMKDAPVLYTKVDQIPTVTADFVEELNSVYMLGGTTVMSAALETAVGKLLEVDELKVVSVSAITTKVAKADEQQLEIAVNEDNKVVTVAELKEAGYTVEFLFNKDTSSNQTTAKTTGLINASVAPFDVAEFKYAVKVTPAEGDAITSEWTTVKVVDATAPVKVTEYGLDFDLDYITLSDKNVEIKATKALNGLGKEIEYDEGEELTPISVTSSDPLVAYYGANGIVPLKEGNAEFTVKFDGIEDAVKVPVEIKAAQKATAIKEADEAFKIQADDETQEVVLTVLDQYNEELRANAVVTLEVKDADGEVVSLGEDNPTIALAKVTTKLNVPAGDYTVAVKSGETVIGNVTVEAVAVDGEIDTFEIVKAEETKFEITVAENGDITKAPANVTIDGYIDGVKVDAAAVKAALVDADGAVFTVEESSDEEVATVAFASDDRSQIVVTPVAAGTTTIKIVKTEGDFVTVLATFDITVDTKVPQVANLTLKDDAEFVEATFATDKTITFDYANLTAGKDESEKEIFNAYMIAEDGVTPIELVETKEGETVTKITGRVIIELKDDFGGGTYFFDFEATPEPVTP